MMIGMNMMEMDKAMTIVTAGIMTMARDMEIMVIRDMEIMATRDMEIIATKDMEIMPRDTAIMAMVKEGIIPPTTILMADIVE